MKRYSSWIPTARYPSICALAAGMLFIGACAGPGYGAQSSPCLYEPWSAPVPLTAERQTVSQHAEIAIADSGRYVVESVIPGNHLSVEVDSQGHRRLAGLSDPTLRLRMPAGEWIEPPLGRPVVGFPRAIVDRHGVLHLVWAEPGPADPIGDSFHWIRFRSLWYAKLEDGAWSRPEPIFRAATVHWSAVQTSALVADPAGALHLALIAEDSLYPSSLTHLRLDRGRWTRSKPSYQDMPAYVDLAAGPGGQLAMVYAVPYEGLTGSHANTLFTVQSTDGGTTWTEARRVTQSSHSPAYEPRILVDRSGLLHLIWLQKEDPNLLDTWSLWYAVSAGEGSAWSDFASLPLSGLNGHLQAAIDRCGAVHLVYTSFDGQRVNLSYTRLQEGEWDAPRPLFADQLAAHPTMRLDDTGRMHLVWNAAPVPSAEDSVLIPRSRLLYSSMSPRMKH